MPRSCVPPLVPLAPPLGAVLRQYAAGSALTCEPVDQGLLNRGYRLCTTRGRYFLKHHFDPETADPAAIARQHRATQRLADLGVPVAPPLTGRDGRTVAVVGGHAYALHPWIDGRHRHGGQLTTAQCGRLGALLGVVHASLEHVMPRQARARVLLPSQAARTRAAVGAEVPTVSAASRAPIATGASEASTASSAASLASGASGPGQPADALHPVGSPDPADTFALIDRLLARVRRHHPADAFDELARHRLQERRTLLERHADRRPPCGSSVGWVHGDFHPFNLLYRGDAPAAIVDWDRLGVKPRAEEAVRAAAIFFVLPVGSLDLPKVRAYARAYRRAAGATPSQLAAAVHRVWWERLNDFWMLRWHYERGDTRADPQFPAASALAVWWTRQYDAVCDAFTD
ncbi:phosphotransferase [Streptomyces sp. ALI-76-A]|uniref:phosphotransferase n=1 Tax=Streptomyces sp. ALI-76-A TaxID=3025736 RepID=UPI00256F4D8C|nr:phosphotransferase [Streptomyces sp. ALI-76-A]MDL5202699.1 phosphotransferase [Streptomyces sp. ALI-76-A]